MEQAVSKSQIWTPSKISKCFDLEYLDIKLKRIYDQESDVVCICGRLWSI